MNYKSSATYILNYKKIDNKIDNKISRLYFNIIKI